MLRLKSDPLSRLGNASGIFKVVKNVFNEFIGSTFLSVSYVCMDCMCLYKNKYENTWHDIEHHAI